MLAASILVPLLYFVVQSIREKIKGVNFDKPLPAVSDAGKLVAHSNRCWHGCGQGGLGAYVVVGKKLRCAFLSLTSMPFSEAWSEIGSRCTLRQAGISSGAWPDYLNGI